MQRVVALLLILPVDDNEIWTKRAESRSVIVLVSSDS